MKRLGTIIYSMIHSILWAVVGTMHYVHKYTCHFHYIKIIMVPCVVSISNDNYYFLFIVLLCLMLYCCFLFDALTFIATSLYKMYAQYTYLFVDGSSCQLSTCIWFSATNTFRSTSCSKQRISNPTFRNTQQSTCNNKSNIKKCVM